MSTSLDSPLHKYLLFIGALGAAYLTVNYLANRKHSTKGTISLQDTRIIIKQIKYQVYANCIPFAEGVDKKLRANYPAKDLDIFLRTELAKVYQSKQDLILQKRGVSKDQYKLALENYGKDAQIKTDQQQIFTVLEESLKGKIDLKVPRPVYQLYTDKQLLEIYRNMCEDIGIKVWEKLLECRRDHPGFNPKDDKHFRQAMRQLNIYDFKVKYLNAKGFKQEWGCSNFIFLKLFEGVKRDNPEIKAASTLIQKGYENIITQISADPDNYDRTHILRIMEDSINPVVPVANKPQPQKPKQVVSAPQPPAQPAGLRQRNPPVVEKTKQEDDDFDMEKLMMEELLSRSQEEPKEEKVEQKLVVSQPVPEQKVEPTPKIQVVIQEKVEQVQRIKVEQSEPERPIEQVSNVVQVREQQQQADKSVEAVQVHEAEQIQPAEPQNPPQPAQHHEENNQPETQVLEAHVQPVPQQIAEQANRQQPIVQPPQQKEPQVVVQAPQEQVLDRQVRPQEQVIQG